MPLGYYESDLTCLVKAVGNETGTIVVISLGLNRLGCGTITAPAGCCSFCPDFMPERMDSWDCSKCEVFS